MLAFLLTFGVGCCLQCFASLFSHHHFENIKKTQNNNNYYMDWKYYYSYTYNDLYLMRELSKKLSIPKSSVALSNNVLATQNRCKMGENVTISFQILIENFVGQNSESHINLQNSQKESAKTIVTFSPIICPFWVTSTLLQE